MKAVIMAGGEGSRLRPLSLGAPKPMTSLLGRPVMEHIILLLKAHKITDICVTLCYKPESIMDYFGTGDALGVRLTYFMEETPLGTAGSVKACMDYIGNEDFLVISGDGVCDLDLSAALAFHQSKKSIATMILYAHDTPLEYGLVITDETGRIRRFLEKPSWGQVVTNTVNTGIYILSPEAMRHVPPQQSYDFGANLFPLLLDSGASLFGCQVGGYWCDMGDSRAYLKCAEDALLGKVRLDMALSQYTPGIWSATPLSGDATILPPCWIGADVALGKGSIIGPCSILEQGSAVGEGCTISHSILLPAAKAEKKATLHGAVLCRRAVAGQDTVLNQGVVLGENSLAEERAVLAERVKLWPGRVAPAGCHLMHSLSEHGQQAAIRFGDSGVISGTLGEDLGPEIIMALGALLGQEGKIGIGCHGGDGAKMLLQAACSGITAAGATALYHDLETAAQAAWLAGYHQLPISLFIEQDGDRVYLHFFQQDSLPLRRSKQRKLENSLLQGELPRVSAGNVGHTAHIQTGSAEYRADCIRRAALYKSMLRPVKVAVDGSQPADQMLRSALEELGCTVEARWKKGVSVFRTAHGGMYLTALDETGAEIESGQLLALVSMIEMENGSGRVAVPEQSTAAIEFLAAGIGGQAMRLERDGSAAAELYSAQPWLRDATFAAVRICSRMGASGEQLIDLMKKTPRFSTWKQEVSLRSGRAQVMNALARTHGRDPELSGGLRLRTGRGWVHLVPLSRRTAIRIMAEGPDLELASELCSFYADQTRQADEALFQMKETPSQEG